MEVIKEMKNHKGYLIYFDGRVYSQKKKKFLSRFLDNRGYLRVCLCDKGHYKPYLVHRLVAENFVENPNNYKTVNHIDENKMNNHFTNLEWMANKDNVNYGTAHIRSGLTRRKPVEAYQGDKIIRFNSVYEAEKLGYGKATTLLQAIRIGSVSGDYKWRYSNGSY